MRFHCGAGGIIGATAYAMKGRLQHAGIIQ